MLNKRKKILLITLIVTFLSLIGVMTKNPLFIVAISLLPIAILIVIDKVFWFVLLFVIFSFFRIHEAIPALYSLKIPLLLSLGALSGLCWHVFISRKIKPYIPKSLKWLAIFWLLVFIGIIFASNRPIALAYFNNIYWKIILMCLAIIWIINKHQQLKMTSITIIIAGILIGLTALSNASAGIGLVEGNRVTIGRALGSMLGDPNDLALVLMFPFAFSVSALLSNVNTRFFRLFAAFTCIILFLAVLETQSRGGLLGLIAISGVFLKYYIKSNTLLLMISLPLALVLYFVAGISDRSSGGSGEEGIDASAMGRLYAWEAAINMAIDNPLTGVGLDNFYYNYFFYSNHWDGLNHAVHSTWFGILAETGFLGLIVFCIFLFSVIRLAKKTTVQLMSYSSSQDVLITLSCAKAIHAGLIGTVVSGTFLTQGFNWPVYILSSLAICVAQIATQFEKKNEEENKSLIYMK